MRLPLSRVAAIAALVVATAVVAVLLIGGGGGSYTIHAKFPDAGQVVKGGLVEVAGRTVGKIDHIELTNDGAADVVLNITADEVTPLHQGTRAQVRAVGLSSVANRFIELSPGPDTAPKIADGGWLDMSHTRGIVDLDALLDTFDEKTRTRLQGIIAEAAGSLEKPTAGQLNGALAVLNPALAQTTTLGHELTLDQAALTQLVRAAGQTADALARQPESLRGALANTSQTLGQLAAHRDALGDSLTRAPAVLARSTKTLRDLQAALPAVDPLLRDLRPAAPGFAKLLRRLVPVTRDALPTFDGVLELLPKAKAALHPIPQLATEAIPALTKGSRSLRDLLPVLEGLRPFAPEIIAGFFEGFGGSTSGYYDANGHLARISFNGGATLLPGVPKSLATALGTQTGMVSRCPGGATTPAEDKSNPFNPAGGTAVCDEGQALK